ncbi:chemotaxis protein [Galenea microaerophila]
MDLLSKIEAQTGTGKSSSQIELLLFRLHGETLYGVNVFKIKEIMPAPPISKVPKSDPRIVGLLDVRGQIISAVDIALALDMPPQDLSQDDITLLYMEFSRQTLCFLIQDVERIVYFNWHDMRLPPDILSHTPYITAITTFENQIVQVIDIEKILLDVMGDDTQIHAIDLDDQALFSGKTLIGVDDSRVARAHLKNIFDKLGVDYHIVKDGKEALELLETLEKEAESEGKGLSNEILAIISDVEMPEMDGYTLVSELKKRPEFKNIPVILNSSISQHVGEGMAKKVGAAAFLTKWDANELLEKLRELAQLKF